MCIQTGKNFTDPNRMRGARRILPEDAPGNDAALRRTGGRRRPHLGDRPALPGHAGKSSGSVPALRFPVEHTTDTYFEYVARMGFEKRRSRLEAMQVKGALKHDLAEYAERLTAKSR